jgi:acyl-CoA reductase-like NAD-dependent aldehyde dehydrogenase
VATRDGSSEFDEATLEAIVEAVVGRVQDRLGRNRSVVTPPATSKGPAKGPQGTPSPAFSAGSAPRPSEPRGPGVHDDLEHAVASARQAFEEYEAMPLARRYDVVAAMRKVALGHLEEMSRRAVDESGLGRVEDKRIKNRVAIEKTPGPEFLEPTCVSGDDGLMIMERAPYGVVCSITPCTNPTETIINNAIGMVAAGNAVLFNVHPAAKRTSAWYIGLLNEAIRDAGGPRTPLLNCLAEPSVESAQQAMRHEGVRLVVVTGGGAVVREAFRSGKRAICAGPGNPPAVVDETAHLETAARGIIAGASFDNNIICTCEKEVIAVSDICDRLIQEMETAGAYRLSRTEVRQLEGTLLDSRGHLNREFVGKNANVLLRSIGRSASDELRLLYAELPEEHPFVQNEMLMPIVGVVRQPDVESAIQCAKRVEHGFGHTAVMYSTNIDHLSRMARVIDTSIFVKNAPNYAGIGAGGEGHTGWTIASPTGEGLTTCRTFSRERRCTLKDHFRIV